jgi:hypothetical protein
VRILEGDHAAGHRRVGAEQHLVAEIRPEASAVVVKDAHARREQDGAARHDDPAGEDQVLRCADLDEGAEALVRRAAHHQVAGEREPHASLRRLRQELAEHDELLGAGDGRVGIRVADRPADQVATGLSAAHDLLDPVGCGVGVAVDEGEDVPPRHGDARGAGACGERARGQLDGADRRQRAGGDLAGVVLARVHDDHLEEMTGLLGAQRLHAAGDRAGGIQRRHDHRDARGA